MIGISLSGVVRSCAAGHISPKEIEKVYCSWAITPDDPGWQEEVDNLLSNYATGHDDMKNIIEQLKAKLLFPRITDKRVPVLPKENDWKKRYFVNNENEIVWQQVRPELWNW